MPSSPPLRPQRTLPLAVDEVAALLAVPVPAMRAEVTGVTHDSRQVRSGDLYAALPGATTHGANFVARAVDAGAVAVLTDPEGAAAVRQEVPALPVLIVPDPRSRLGEVAARVYGDPARDLLVIGVTGTNGKTTTTYLIDAGLRAAGHRTGLIGTVETRVADERVDSVRTTPEATEVHALLALMRERGVTACVMEVSSHALALGRVDGIVFDLAAFTNLSQDHLDFHRNLDDYFGTKATLFTPARSRRGAVCVDDEYGRRLAREATVPVTTVASGEQGAADWRVAARTSSAGGSIRARLEHRSGRQLSISAPMPGDFNVANTALAVVTLIEAGVDTAAAVPGIAACAGVPGRMERVGSNDPGLPLAVVDYAHTPDAVENVLRALRPATAGRLVVVLGAGGDRDPHKRASMGAAAARHADLTIVTDDNPRTEDPAAIRKAVLSGAEAVAIPDRGEIREIGDRAAAIGAAVAATSGRADTVAVVGKGHEQGQEIAGVKHPFDDRVALRAALQDRAGRRR